MSSSGVARVWRRVRRSVFDAAVLSTRVCASISWMSTLANYFTSGSVHSRPERTENQERTGNFLMLPPPACLASQRSSSVGWWWRRFGPRVDFAREERRRCLVPIKYVFMLFCFKQPRKVCNFCRLLSGNCQAVASCLSDSMPGKYCQKVIEVLFCHSLCSLWNWKPFHSCYVLSILF